jgi:hypothetical protein
MIELARLKHLLIDYHSDFREFMERIEFFVNTRPGALLALRSITPNPELAELHKSVLLATEQEVKSPKISILRAYCNNIEHVIKSMQDHPDSAPNPDILQKQLDIAVKTINYYGALDRSTKQILKTAQWKPYLKQLQEYNPRLYNYVTEPDDLPSLPKKKDLTKSNVKRMDIKRAEDLLSTITKTMKEFDSSTKALAGNLSQLISTTDIAQVSPELPFIAQDVLDSRDVLLTLFKKYKGLIHKHIDQLEQQSLPDPLAVHPAADLGPEPDTQAGSGDQ